jgi:hypothetical protein
LRNAYLRHPSDRGQYKVNAYPEQAIDGASTACDARPVLRQWCWTNNVQPTNVDVEAVRQLVKFRNPRQCQRAALIAGVGVAGYIRKVRRHIGLMGGS